jgi:hypothetical protein
VTGWRIGSPVEQPPKPTRGQDNDSDIVPGCHLGGETGSQGREVALHLGEGSRREGQEVGPVLYRQDEDVVVVDGTLVHGYVRFLTFVHQVVN